MYVDDCVGGVGDDGVVVMTCVGVVVGVGVAGCARFCWCCGFGDC